TTLPSLFNCSADHPAVPLLLWCKPTCRSSLTVVQITLPSLFSCGADHPAVPLQLWCRPPCRPSLTV
ncbi:hypothetical protein NDU88_000322, partial [Pleurodeles waltl]